MVAGDRREGLRADELGGGSGKHHLDLGAGVDQPASEVGGLVSGYPTGDTEDDSPPVEHEVAAYSSTVSTETLPSAISSIAMVKGLRESVWT